MFPSVAPSHRLAINMARFFSVLWLPWSPVALGKVSISGSSNEIKFGSVTNNASLVYAELPEEFVFGADVRASNIDLLERTLNETLFTLTNFADRLQRLEKGAHQSTYFSSLMSVTQIYWIFDCLLICCFFFSRLHSSSHSHSLSLAYRCAHSALLYIDGAPTCGRSLVRQPNSSRVH